MTARPAFPASYGDAPRRPALWEGRSSLSAALALWMPSLIGLGLFFGGMLAGALAPGLPGTARLRIGREAIPIDTGTAEAIGMGFAGIVLLFLLVFLAAILVPVVRSRRQFYRVDGEAVELAADGVIDRIAIADIRRVVPHGYGAWHRVRIVGKPGERILMVLGTRDAARLLRVLRGLGVACGALDAIHPPAEADRLVPGESVRWRGRPGLASFDAGRAFLLFALCLPLAFLATALALIWSAGAGAVTGLFFSGVVFSLFGYLALYLLAIFHERLRAWACDAFGAVLVTDRRIAWAAPFSGRIYRDVAFAALIEAVIVERRGRRAWVTLTIRKADDVRSEDLRGLPDADRFLAVLRPAAQ